MTIFAVVINCGFFWSPFDTKLPYCQVWWPLDEFFGSKFSPCPRQPVYAPQTIGSRKLYKIKHTFGEYSWQKCAASTTGKKCYPSPFRFEVLEQQTAEIEKGRHIFFQLSSTIIDLLLVLPLSSLRVDTVLSIVFSRTYRPSDNADPKLTTALITLISNFTEYKNAYISVERKGSMLGMQYIKFRKTQLKKGISF